MAINHQPQRNTRIIAAGSDLAIFKPWDSSLNLGSNIVDVIWVGDLPAWCHHWYQVNLVRLADCAMEPRWAPLHHLLLMHNRVPRCHGQAQLKVQRASPEGAAQCHGPCQDAASEIFAGISWTYRRIRSSLGRREVEDVGHRKKENGEHPPSDGILLRQGRGGGVVEGANGGWSQGSPEPPHRGTWGTRVVSKPVNIHSEIRLDAYDSEKATLWPRSICAAHTLCLVQVYS
jgi:hypothetical protein